MTPEKLKHLAEFANTFLPGQLERLRERLVIDHRTSDEYMLFKDSVISPVIMHLAQVEMEKRGYNWTLKYIQEDGVYYKRDHYEVTIIHKNGKTGAISTSDNKFIAFWSAVRETVKR